MRLLRSGFAALAAMAVSGWAAAAARADTIKFQNPGANVADGGSAATDYTGSSLTWSAFGLTVTGGVDANSSGTLTGGEFSTVIQDLVPAGAGLGVVAGDEEVDAGQILVLTFTTTRILTHVQFRDYLHNSGNAAWTAAGSKFELYVDGVDKGAFDLRDDVSFAGMVGKVFTFNHVGSSATGDFYIGSVTEVTAEPATLALFGIGAAGVLLARRRNRRRA